jgi:membrane fusion protein (multidrug efflux system)
MPPNGEYESLKRELESLREQIAALRQNQTRNPADSAQSDNGASGTDESPAPGEHETAAAHARERFWRTVATVRRRPYYLLPIMALLAGIAYGGYYAWTYFHSYESTSDAEISGAISPITSKVMGAVSKVLVQNGQTVKAGQALIELDPEPYRLAVKIARAKYDAAKAAAEIARHNYDTLSGNQHTHILPGAAAKAKASVFAARQMVAARSAAEAGAEAALDAAQLKLHYTTLTAPVSGTIAESSVEVGQDVQPSQRLMAIVQTGPLWITAKFKETQLRRLHRGQAVTIHVDALDHDYEGDLESIAPATISQFSLLPPENATGNYVKIVQRIAARIGLKPGQSLARLRPGMSVEATVWVNRG